MNQDEPKFISPLSPTEMMILQMLADDKTQIEIAQTTWRSYWTIHSHVRNAHRKVGTHTLHGLIAWALRYEVIE